MAAVEVPEPSGIIIPAGVRSSNRREYQGVGVRFYNISRRKADVIWINHRGEPIKYATLLHKQFIDMVTFVEHPWIFREEGTGVPMITHDKHEVFWPEPAENPASLEQKLVRINVGDFNLLDLCVRAVAINLQFSEVIDKSSYIPPEIDCLPIPITLKYEIHNFALRSSRYIKAIGQPLAPQNLNGDLVED